LTTLVSQRFSRYTPTNRDVPRVTSGRSRFNVWMGFRVQALSAQFAAGWFIRAATWERAQENGSMCRQAFSS
jgi:hypothetical protein